MKHRTGMQMEMLTRVAQVLSSHPELAEVAASPAGIRVTAMIADIIARNAEQDRGARGSRGETARKRALRRKLLIQLRAISGAAQLKLRTEPEMVQFRMPRPSAAVEAVLTSAKGMREAAAQHEAALLAAGLKPNFLGQLDAAIDAVRGSLAGRTAHRRTRGNATASIKAISSDIPHLIRVLDGMVIPLIEGNTGLIAEWAAAKRIGYKPGGPRLVVAADNAAAPAATVTPLPTKEVIAPAA